MKASIAWWDLANSSTTIDALNSYLRAEGLEPWREVDGLQVKVWFSDREHNRWGALMVWEDDAKVATSLPPNRAAEMIGYAPTFRTSLDLEGLVGALTEPLRLTTQESTHDQ